MDAIPIFSVQTGLGTFRIDAARSAFDITCDLPKMAYALRNDTFPAFVAPCHSPYDAILAVAQHRTGVPEWDASAEVVSDYAPDWTRHAGKRFQMGLLDAHLLARPDDGVRDMVDYFERRHPYFLDRLILDELLTEVVTTGQLDRLPSMHLVPAEMRGLARLAAHWGVPAAGGGGEG